MLHKQVHIDQLSQREYKELQLGPWLKRGGKRGGPNATSRRRGWFGRSPALLVGSTDLPNAVHDISGTVLESQDECQTNVSAYGHNCPQAIKHDLTPSSVEACIAVPSRLEPLQ
jgi:hypothetical protein